jgi:Cu+-exporting ATPase
LHDLLRISRIIFGRSGTLSQGHLRIVSLQASPAATPGELVVLAASAHQDVEDIWGKAFLAFGISHRVHLRPVEKVQVEPGQGLSALVDDKTVLVGQPSWLEQYGVTIEGLDEPIQEHRRLGRQMLFVGIAAPEPRCLGVIAFADPPRAGTSQLIRTCKQSGFETVLAGDIAQTATATLAGLAGVKNVVPEGDIGKFDKETTLVIARTSDIQLLARYDNAVALGETALQRLPSVPFGIQRNDTRHVLDFIVLAQVMSRRLPLTLLLVWITGWPLVADGLGLLAIPPMLRLACLAAGVLIALVQSQLLRLVDSLANDEHED